METIYIPDPEFVSHVQKLRTEGKAELIGVEGKMRWVIEEDGVKKLIRPESSKPNEQ